MEGQVLFIHGGGEGAHEEDKKLAASLQYELGAAYDVQYPELPDEGSPGYGAWRDRISRELAALDGEVILVGHSLGGSILLKYLCEEKVENPVSGIFLIAAPYWGAEDWKAREYELREDFASMLPGDLAMFFYHSRDDEVVPFVHLAPYRERLPQASFNEVDGRGHQFDDDLSEVARDIERLQGRYAMTENEGNYAEVNGLEMYYEVHGAGQPLVLLHGGVGAIEMFGEVLPMLAEGRQVIGVDLQAHGRTADMDRPLSHEHMADDVAALIEHLQIERADVMGYSLGGGVALQTAIRHPEVVRKLVVVSTTFRRDGWYPEVLAGMEQMGPEAAEPMKATPMYRLYSGIAPRPEDWPVLLTKLGELLRRDYDWSEDVAEIQAPTMTVVGDADSVRTAHAVELFELLGGGRADGGWDRSGMSDARLAILPATTHYEIFFSPTLASTVTPFLDENVPEAD